MAKKQEKKQSFEDAVSEMNTKGVEQKMPGTERIVRVRTLDARDLLVDGKLPDILTPLVVKSVYQELSDRELREYLGKPAANKEDALAHLDAIDYIVEKCLVDGTKVKTLTIGEKRWLFRLAMGPAEMLITFRYDPTLDVEPVAEGDEVQQAAE